MKRLDLVRHVEEQGCVAYREGAKHSVFLNPENGRLSAVPRHREIDIFLARKICRQLDIAMPRMGV
jgi:mRNA interferase HicA